MDESHSLLSYGQSDYGVAYSVTESALERVDPITLSWRDIRYVLIHFWPQLHK